MLAPALVISTALVAAPVQDAPAAPTPSEQAVMRGVDFILERQEGEPRAEWPYEGVYRVRGEIPIGYRVGGSAIAVLALTQAPDYDTDERRRAAVKRSVAFIARSVGHPLMAHEKITATYDVRGWGYTYGLAALLHLRKHDQLPDDLEGDAELAIRFFLDGIEATAIPERGGWNYARRAGFDEPGRSSPFMTAPTLQALFEAEAQGFDVDDAVIRAGLDALERARTKTGSFAYAGEGGGRSRESVPGSVGRMLVSEVTLALADRSTVERVRGALDAFIVHWNWLEKRRAQPGTHVRPYGIAPYYFFYAHYYAAQAVTMLPEHERGEYRRRIEELLFSVREEDGTWNDRIFPRSAAYGTSMAVLALVMPQAGEPVGWVDAGADAGTDAGTAPAPAASAR